MVPAPFSVGVPRLRSCAEGVATFPETASSVGGRLLDGDGMLVVAPHGLDDLFGRVCRHNVGPAGGPRLGRPRPATARGRSRAAGGRL